MNTFEDAKNTLDSNLEKYVSQQISLDRSYLVENVSIYAEKSYEYAKMAQYFRSAKPDKDGIATIVFKKKLLKMFWLHFKKILA
ncbi:hypothetical protein [Lactobacillus crispatus]|uniref:Uncharacterized protein n=1 Tax=Lactobacillus crispatus TaxID=47770 RepID=A0AB73BRV4_9LACO|nr:hypothetical protein [Lactobacillus crispatus]KAA8792592.1 hypothetical protein F1B99_06350 [Lactobacillus crispatus]KAA8795867.1 hypothetical protein F1B96_09045 [Lactobacillus crispatus]KAA8799037.1 hypothetical protein F1C02_02540 [Lactobacillus crispatus]KAA8802129.1 hypothetical protein F1C03_01660 [Lactobacillus crispatus]KAA8802223.1 hypothetical protein F1C04_08820 [Lactobacillus crispatus]